MYEEIIYEVEEPVATITNNRPAPLTARTPRTQVELKHDMIPPERPERAAGTSLTRPWSARRVDAQEAERLGLVDRVVPDDELLPTTRGYIEDLARNSSPASIMIMKRQVYLHLMKPLHEAMEDTNRLMAESLTGDDFREGVASFVEKRAPAFPRV